MEILPLVLDALPCQDLGRLVSSCRRWDAHAAAASERRVLGEWGSQFSAFVLPRVRRNERQAQALSAANPGWLRALALLETLQTTVGLPPVERGWRDELSTVRDADAALRSSCKFPWALELREEGWTTEHAHSLALLYTWANRDIARSVRERSTDFAASTWAVCEALLTAGARQQQTGPPTSYANLFGRGGLATDDPS